MPYTDFHYVPTGTGVISGKEVLEQTEDAINDLGQQTAAGVDQAIDTANNALNTANTAMADAQNAVNVANTAQTTATNAQNTANAAQTTATNAQNAATAAQNDVDALENVVTGIDGRLTTTEGNVTNLTTRMGTAEGNITTLQNDVLTAQGTATSAQNTATLAREQAYVTRYTNTAVSDNSTVAYANITNTNNIKADDLLLDTNGKLYQISSVDTANETVSVTTPLTQLAVDSDVVHKSGDETINGVKSFINYFLGKDLSGQTVDLNDCVDAYSGAIHYYYAVSNYTNISNKPENKPFILESKTVRYVSSIDYIYYQKIYTADNNAPPSIYARYYRSGAASWSNWIKDTDKFVTTDTNQTISGNKTFSSINGVEPSSLGMPDINNRIDISSYITDLSGVNNEYTPTVNGWISVRSGNATKISILDSATGIGNASISNTATYLTVMTPVVANRKVYLNVMCTSLNHAYFIPCQGNV